MYKKPYFVTWSPTGALPVLFPETIATVAMCRDKCHVDARLERIHSKCMKD